MPTPGDALYREILDAVKVLARAPGGTTASGESVAPLSDADRAELRKIARRHRQQTDRLNRIWRSGPKAKFEHTRGVYLGAHTTRVAATVRALAKTRRHATLQDIREFAKHLNVWGALTEPVRVSVRPKSKGGHRLITRHGPRRMAQQFIVRDLLTAVGVDNEFDFARRGAGGERAMIREVCQRIENGFRHWRTADVKECFASLRPAHLGWLPVPKPLLRNVVFLPGCAKVRIVARTAGAKLLTATSVGLIPSSSPPSIGAAMKLTKERVRRGLPEGSVLSPLVARAFVGRELRAALGNDEIARCSFVDDLVLGARTRPKLDQALGDLRTRLSAHPAGPISLHVDPPTSASRDGGLVRALGYELLPGQGHGANPIHVRPGRERFARFYKKLYDRWKAEGQPSDLTALESFVLERLDRWMPSQQAWTAVPGHSRQLAFTCAFVDLCERASEEFRKTSCP